MLSRDHSRLILSELLVYEASVIWDGQVRTIEINESEADPLVGMGLLEGYELKIQAVAGGSVTITALP